jgi:hypothetical protein
MCGCERFHHFCPTDKARCDASFCIKVSSEEEFLLVVDQWSRDVLGAHVDIAERLVLQVIHDLNEGVPVLVSTKQTGDNG